MSDYPDVSKLKVSELKELCEQYGLETKGLKKDLQQRLNEYFESNPGMIWTDWYDWEREAYVWLEFWAHILNTD